MAFKESEKLRRWRREMADIDARISREQARESKAERKKDTRRKILLGAILLHRVQDEADPEGWLREFVEPHLVRDDDRALFGLPPRAEAG